MPGACTTCTETSGNGAQTGMENLPAAALQILLVLREVTTALTAAAALTTALRPVGLRTEMATLRDGAANAWGSAV